MKLSVRLGLIIVSAALGLLLICGIALQGIHSTMTAEREMQTRTLLNLSVGVLKYYNGLETSGAMPRADAQRRAAEALQSFKSGNDYVFARDDQDVMVAHPTAARVGKQDLGATLPDGRKTVEAYREALSKADPAFVVIHTVKPGSDSKEEFPKLNGVTRFAPWGWTVGTGFFVDDIDRAFRGYAITLLLAGLAIVSIATGLAVVMARGIYRQLGGEPASVVAAADRIATGHLGQHLPAAPAGSLIDSLSRMQVNLQGMLASIKHSAGELNTAATDIALRMSDIHKASGLSSEATSATAAAIEEMTVSVGQIAENAHDSENSSSRSVELAGRGREQVVSAADAIQVISSTMAQASTQIAELAERTREIGSIANTIHEIAEQTNLLALNAAIEAARAGEQGRGFAVVADEVRKLAERTAKATAEIATTIGAVQQDTGQVVERMREATPLIEKGVALASEAADTLNAITDEAREALAKVHDVAHSTAEQTSASNSIASNIERIAQMVEESDRAVRSATETTHALADLARELNTAADKFTL